MKYRAEIDGLRAIAVLPVILFHAGVGLFSGGFVGVDIFFVISGYLITSILINDIENDRYSILDFYVRRARRILPALFTVIAVITPIAWLILSPFDMKEYAQSVFATSIFSSNVYFWLKSGYFDAAAETKPLLHTWSLAVEEQYYVFFPVFLFLAWRLGKRNVFALIVLLALASLGLAEYGWRNFPDANFYLAPSRAWELFAGSIAAFLINKRGIGSSNLLSLAGLAAIAFSIVAFDSSTPFPSLYALVPVLGSFAIIMWADKDTVTARLLSTRGMVFIGLLSYSAYLWHQPLFAFYRLYFFEEPNALWIALLTVLTLVLSYLSWRFVEGPTRKGKLGAKGKSVVLALSAAGILVFAGVGVAGHVMHGFPQRNPDLARLAQNGGLSLDCSGAAMDDAKCRSSANPQVAVWGDSFAMHFVTALDAALPGKGVHQLTMSACPPVPGVADTGRRSVNSCADYNRAVEDYLLRQPNAIQMVVLSSSRDLAGPDYLQGMTGIVQRLKAAGQRVVIVGPTAKSQSTERCVNLAVRRRIDPDSCRFPLTQATNVDAIEALKNLARREGVEFVDLSDFMCPDGICRTVMGDKIVLRDEGHLTLEIQPKLAEFLASRLSQQ